jgi:hypothetical protein
MNISGRPNLRITVALIVLLAGCSDGRVGPTAPDVQFAVSAPVVITFEKEFTGDFAAGPWEWEGEAQVPGVGKVALFSSIDLSQVSVAGQVLHAPVSWSLTAPGFSTEAVTDGTINLQTGRVRTSGRVVAGQHAGALVQQEGQLDGLDAAGFIQIMPAATR